MSQKNRGRIVGRSSLLVCSLSFTMASGLLASGSAFAESLDDAFRGKTIDVYIGSGAGGGYDFYGRLLTRHMGRHIPGQPHMVPQNMPGAGSLRAANYVYNVAPKDGTALGIVAQTVALEEALGTPAVQYEASKFNWIGRLTPNVDVSITWHTSKVKSIADAKKYEAAVAGTGQGNVAEVMPRVLNSVVGTKFKVISGYEGANIAMAAMEKGEVDGAATSWTTLKVAKRNWLTDKKVNILVQYTPERHPDLPHVPSLVELGTSEEDRQVLGLYASSSVVGRSFMAPPGVPADRVAALRAAFDAMTKDPEFLAEVKKAKIEFDPMPGAALQRVIEEAGKVSEVVRERARAARGL